MKTISTLTNTIVSYIDNSDRDIFVRKDFEGIARYDQIGQALNQLINKGKIVRIGKGVYAKAIISPLSKRIVPCKPLSYLATEFLKTKNVDVFPSSYDRAYNEGRSTQVPTGRVIGVKERISRKIGYDGKYITFECVA